MILDRQGKELHGSVFEVSGGSLSSLWGPKDKADGSRSFDGGSFRTEGECEMKPGD